VDNLGFRTQFSSLLVAYAMGAEDHVTQLLGGLLHLAGKKQCCCGYNLQQSSILEQHSIMEHVRGTHIAIIFPH
jgi:hypothetical protein